MTPRSKYPLRVRYAGTDPVHAAKEHGVKGHATPCLLWLDPADPHIWCSSNTEITCTKCIERMGPTAVEHPVPGAMGTLQQRLAEVVENEVPAGYSELAGQRVTETVEAWRREVEDRIRLVVEGTLAGAIPWPARSAVADTLVTRVLASMAVGGGAESEETGE